MLFYNVQVLLINHSGGVFIYISLCANNNSICNRYNKCQNYSKHERTQTVAKLAVIHKS